MVDAARSIPIIVLAGQSNANSAGIGMAVFDQVRAEGGLYVHVAVGGSSLGPDPTQAKGDWNPFGGGSPLAGANLDSLIEQIRAMLDPASPFYVPGAYLDKVVWIQGEADAWVTGLAANYQGNLTALRAALVDQFGAHDMVISALSDAAINATTSTDQRRANYQAVQQAQLAVAAADAGVYLVDPDTVAAATGYTPATMLFPDMVHYNVPTGFAAILGRALMQAGPTIDNPAAPPSGETDLHYVTGTLLNDRLSMAAVGLGQGYGAAGIDLMTLTGRSDGVQVQAGGMDALLVTAHRGEALHLDLVSIEQLVLTPGADLVTMAATLAMVDTGRGSDQVTGRILDDVIYLRGGSDRAYGSMGQDQIYAGAGQDLIDGGDGNDALSGGNGDDQLTGGAGADSVAGGAGNDELAGGDGNDVLYGGAGADLLIGDDGNDLLWGGYDSDQLQGGTGTDTLSGGAGNDMLTAADGNDQLWGGEDDDGLSGGAGDDTLSGGVGNDVLAGGDGADAFVFWTGGGTDRITDFADGTDLITLNAPPQSLTISSTNLGTIVTASDLTLLIEGVDSTLITAADFIFA